MGTAYKKPSYLYICQFNRKASSSFPARGGALAQPCAEPQANQYQALPLVQPMPHPPRFVAQHIPQAGGEPESTRLRGQAKSHAHYPKPAGGQPQTNTRFPHRDLLVVKQISPAE